LVDKLSKLCDTFEALRTTGSSEHGQLPEKIKADRRLVKITGPVV